MNKKTITTSRALKWSAFERLLSQIIQFGIMLYLGRCLGPEPFGIIAIVMMFVSISQVFVDGGFSNALIQKIDRTEDDISTVFILNFLISLVCYSLVYMAAPWFANYYEEPMLTDLIRVVMVCVIINVFSLIQRTKLTIDLDFKTISYASILSILISSIVAVVLVNLGYGVWSLVWQTISLNLLNAIILNLNSPSKLKFAFSKTAFYSMFNFSVTILLSNLLEVSFNNIYSLIIGRYFNLERLGEFNQAKQISTMPPMTFSRIVVRTLFPAMSKIQNDDDALRNLYKKSIRLSAFFIFPSMTLVAIVSEGIVSVTLGDNWSNISEMIFILSLAFMFYPINAINVNLLQVKKMGGVFLKLEIIKKIIAIFLLFSTFGFGIIYICIGIAIQSVIELAINAPYTKQITKLGYLEQFKLYVKPLLLTFICYVLSYVICSENFKDYNEIIQAILFVFLYCITVILLEMKSLAFIKKIKINR